MTQKGEAALAAAGTFTAEPGALLLPPLLLLVVFFFWFFCLKLSFYFVKTKISYFASFFPVYPAGVYSWCISLWLV